MTSSQYNNDNTSINDENPTTDVKFSIIVSEVTSLSMAYTTYPSDSATTTSTIREIEDPQYKNDSIKTNDENFTTEVESSTKTSATSSSNSVNTTIQEIEDQHHYSENSSTSNGNSLSKYCSIMITNYIIILTIKIIFF